MNFFEVILGRYHRILRIFNFEKAHSIPSHMGVGSSTHVSLYASSNIFSKEKNSAFSISTEDKILSKRFTSYLFDPKKANAITEYEPPCDELIADIILSPHEYTQYESAIDAVEKVILPLLKGSDESKPITHQLLLQYFKFLKNQSAKYLTKEKNYIEKKRKKAMKDVMNIVRLHSLHSVQVPSEFTSFTDLLKVIPPHIDSTLAFQQGLENQCKEISAKIKDIKSAVVALVYGFVSGNISLLINILVFLDKLNKNKKAKIDFKYPNIFDNIAEMPLDTISMFPQQKIETLYSKIADHTIEADTMCSNGKSIFIPEDGGYISVYINGVKKTQKKFSKKNLYITSSNGYIYATDGEKEYLFNHFPLSKIVESPYNSGKYFHSKHKINFPCASDGYYIYSLSKGKKINIFVIKPEVQFINSIELKTGSRKLKDPYSGEIVPKGSFLYTNGIFLSFIIIGTNSHDTKKFQYFVRNFSAFTGEHIGDRTFYLDFPITAISYDPFNHCFYGLSPSQNSATILKFPYFGPVASYLTGITFNSQISLEETISKFQKMKSSEDACNHLLNFFIFTSLHFCGLSFHECNYGKFYEPKFAKFFIPNTNYFYDCILKSLHYFIEDQNLTPALALLGILQINMANNNFSNDDKCNGTNLNVNEILKLFEKILNNKKMKILHKPICFIITSCFDSLFENQLEKIPSFFKFLMEQGESFTIYAIYKIRETDLLPYCFSIDDCRTKFTSIFDVFIEKKEITFQNLVLLENFQNSLCKQFILAYVKSKGVILKEMLTIKQIFLTYSQLICQKYSEYFQKYKKLENDEFAIIALKFLFLIKPVLKYSRVSQVIIQPVYELLIMISKEAKDNSMIENDSFSFFYSFYYEILYIYIQCNTSILKGGKEVNNCSDFLWIRQPLVDANMSADVFDSVSYVIFDHDNSKKLEKVQNIGNIIGIKSKTLISFFKETLLDTNQEALNTLYKKYSNILSKNLTQKEKQLERIIFLLFTKYLKYFKEVEDFLKTNNPNSSTKEIIKSVYKIRSKLREIIQHKKGKGANCDLFVEDLLQKGIYLLFMDFKSINHDEIMKDLNAFLFSKYKMKEIFNMISSADRARKAIQIGREYTEKILHSELPLDITTFVFDYMFIHKVLNKYVKYVDKKIESRSFSFAKKEYISNDFLVFYYNYLISLVKSDSQLLKSRILDLLNIIKLVKIPKSFTILTLFIISSIKDEVEKSEISKEFREGVREIIKSSCNADETPLQKLFNVPILRVAFHSNFSIPFSASDVIRHIKTDKLVTHSHFCLLYEMIEKETEHQDQLFKQILTDIGNICTGKIHQFSETKSFHEAFVICEEYLQLCRKLLSKPTLSSIIEYILKVDIDQVGKKHNSPGKTGKDIYHDQIYIAAAFAILSNPFEFKHIHSLVESSTTHTNYYLASIENNETTYHLWTLPISHTTSIFIVKTENSKEIKPICQYRFTPDLYPHYSQIIPFIVKTLHTQSAKVHLFYIYQSFKSYLVNPHFLNEFISSQQSLRLNSFSFWNIATSYFKDILSCPIVKSSKYEFTLCSTPDETTKIGKNFIESSKGFHFLFSHTIFEETILNLTIEKGNVRFGIQALSLFPFNLHICSCEGKNIVFNDFPVKIADEEPDSIVFDPHQHSITFKNGSNICHKFEVPQSTYCFFIAINGPAKLQYKMKHNLNNSESDDEIGEDAKEFLTHANDVTIIEYPKEVLEAIGTSLNTTLRSDKLPIFHSCDATKLSSLSPFGIFNPKIGNSITSETRKFLLKELFLSMRTELMTETFLNSLTDIDKTLTLFKRTPQELVLIMSSLLLLIEPLKFDGSIIDFSYNLLAKKPNSFEFKCIDYIMNYFEPKYIIELWLENLKMQFTQPDFHFADAASVRTLVYHLQSFDSSRTVSVQKAHAFIIFRLGFGMDSSAIANCGTEVLTGNNIVYIQGNHFEMQKVENVNDQTIIVIPLFENPNLSLYNSFVELAVSLKYFILYLSENAQKIDVELLKSIKQDVYKMFIDAIDSKSPFFYTNLNTILHFIKIHLPLCPSDLDAKIAQSLSLFAIYSKENSLICNFLSEIQIIWDEKALLPLKSFFPQFLSESDKLELEKRNKDDIKWELPSPKFPEFLDSTSDNQTIMNAVINLLKPRDSIQSFPFQFLLHFWATFTSQFPPFEKKILSNNRFAIKFLYYKPDDFEFHFKAETPPKYTILQNETVEGYDFVIESNNAKTEVEKDKFVIFSKSKVNESQYIFDHRERFSSDIVALFEKWDLVDDEKLIKSCPIGDLTAPSLPLTIVVQKLISSNLNLFPSVLSIRYLLLKILNWLFFSQKMEIPNDSKILYDSLSFSMRLNLFKGLIEERSSSGHENKLVINRKSDFDVRDGLNSDINQTIIGQLAKYYKNPKAFRNKGDTPWSVTFEGERGLDGGGPARELVVEAAKDLMSQQCGIFSDTKAHFFVPIGRCTDPNIYKFVGVLLGIVIRNSLVQDFRLPPFFWEYLCGRDITIEDIYSFDFDYKERIDNLMNMTQDDFDSNMTFVEKDFQGNEKQLKPGKLTYESRNEFIELSNQFRISEIQNNLKVIRDGFYENIDVKLPYYVTPRLLEFSVCGTQKISYDTLTKMIKFDGVKFAQRKIFLDVIKAFTSEERSKLLKFVTGRVRLPIILTSDFLFTVDYLYGDNDGLPKASACLRQFHLPSYSNFETAYKMIKVAIEFAGTFENK